MQIQQKNVNLNQNAQLSQMEEEWTPSIPTKNSVLNYKTLLQHRIKQGKKNTIEKKFTQGLIFWAKSNLEKDFDFILEKAFLNATPFIGVKSKRKGSKNIFLPKKLSTNRSMFLATKWILTNSFEKKKRHFYEGLFEELIESSKKKSASVKKREDLHKLAEESLTNM